ncbi:hypothetical protein Dimus_013698, partial [Dionaea muscipula]
MEKPTSTACLIAKVPKGQIMIYENGRSRESPISTRAYGVQTPTHGHSSDSNTSSSSNHLASLEKDIELLQQRLQQEKSMRIMLERAINESQVHDYMVSQPDINEKMSAILVDWLIEVHNKFDLMPETLYLTVNLVDRFLAVKMVPRRELQLLGISVMLIACKYEEIWAPEILRMEKIILHHLEWELTVPTCYVFLVRFIKASILDNEMEKNLVVVVSGEEVSSIKLYLEYLKPLVSKLDTPTDLREHLAL